MDYSIKKLLKRQFLEKIGTMKVLGLYDWHNSGAALVEDGRIVAAIEEERLSRRKIEFGMPVRSIKKILSMTETSWQDLDAIAIVGQRDPTPLLRMNSSGLRFKRKMGYVVSGACI